MHKKRWQPGFCPEPRWGSLRRSPIPLVRRLGAFGPSTLGAFGDLYVLTQRQEGIRLLVLR
jgi:hypothetical protein